MISVHLPFTPLPHIYPLLPHPLLEAGAGKTCFPNKWHIPGCMVLRRFYGQFFRYGPLKRTEILLTAEQILLLHIVLSAHPDKPAKQAVTTCCQTSLSHNKATNLHLTDEKRDKKVYGLDHGATHQRRQA